MIKTSVQINAADRKQGMTIAEIAEFVALAYARDIPETTPVEALIRMNGRLTALKVENK